MHTSLRVVIPRRKASLSDWFRQLGRMPENVLLRIASFAIGAWDDAPYLARVPSTEQIVVYQKKIMTCEENHQRVIKVVIISVAEALFGDLDLISRTSKKGERVRQCLFYLRIWLEAGLPAFPPYVDRSLRTGIVEGLIERIRDLGGWDSFEGLTSGDLIHRLYAHARDPE